MAEVCEGVDLGFAGNEGGGKGLLGFSVDEFTKVECSKGSLATFMPEKKGTYSLKSPT